MNPPVRSRPSLSTLAALLFCLLLLPLAQPVSAAVDPKMYPDPEQYWEDLVEET